jgi:hypothetical protein
LHAWDLARAAGGEETLDADLVETESIPEIRIFIAEP